MVEKLVDSSLATAEEILNYAEEEFERALKINDMLLYRNAVDKAFLSIIVAVNSYINRKLGVIPRSHSERRILLRKVDREDLRALYSDIMRTLHEEAFYEGVFNPEEAKYAISLVKRMLEEIKKANVLTLFSYPFPLGLLELIFDQFIGPSIHHALS